MSGLNGNGGATTNTQPAPEPEPEATPRDMPDDPPKNGEGEENEGCCADLRSAKFWEICCLSNACL